MLKQKNLFVVVFMVLVMSLVAACGGSSGGGNANSAHLTVWAMGAEGDNLKTLAADFTKQNPGIQVSVQSIPWSDAHSKFLTAIAGQQTPDLAEMGTTWMAEFAKTGALDTPPSSIDPNSFFKSAWDTAVVNGTAYGAPWYVDTRVLYYRTDIAQKAGISSPPQNWNQLLADARAMQ